MTDHDDLLPSWRPGQVRDALVSFLRAARDVPPEQRTACFDNDGTLWCEKPHYVQLDFFLDALGARAQQDPSTMERPEFAALASGDRAEIGRIGLPRIALALAGLFEGLSPQQFGDQVRAFLAEATHPTLGRRLVDCTYQPMLELVAELRRLDFAVFVVTGGGTEFVRAVSQELYGVPTEGVVGTLIDYDFIPGTDTAAPRLARTSRLVGGANEGPVKVTNIQTQLGRRPLLAGGNSSGDREMLEWAAGGDGPHLALLVDHDDAEREFSYAGTAETFAESEPITEVAARLGWTVASMRRDWETVFA